jgi:hypothetical protein
VFLHAAGWFAGPAFIFSIWSLVIGEYRDASLWAAAFAVCFCYCMAFYERRDTTPRK